MSRESLQNEINRLKGELANLKSMLPTYPENDKPGLKQRIIGLENEIRSLEQKL